MARSGAAAPRGGGQKARGDSAASDGLSRQQKLELYCFMRLTRLLEERVAGEITARINETAFEWLDAPVLRITAADVPLPYSPPLEDYVLPQTSDVVLALRRLAAY